MRIRTSPLLAAFAASWLIASSATAQQKPNILVIWGDDIGQSNASAYSRGLMGYKTPNIDRISEEGMLFTDYYGEQSCTAGCWKRMVKRPGAAPSTSLPSPVATSAKSAGTSRVTS